MLRYFAHRRSGNLARQRSAARARGVALVAVHGRGAVGIGALVLEMTWSRQLALALGGSTYAYSATLFVVLMGIASGSLLFHLRGRGVGSISGGCRDFWAGRDELRRQAVLAVAVDICRRPSRIRGTLIGNAGLCVLVAAIVEFLPAVAMGMLFPLFVDLTHERASRVGRTVGNFYAWNTFGSVAGATLTGVLLFPRIGTAGAMGGDRAVPGRDAAGPAARTVRERATAVGCAVVLGAIVFGISLPIDPLRTNMGQYMYGSQEGILESMRCPYYVDGPSSSVAVVTYGEVASLRINGKADAGNSLDMQTQVGLAYVPRLLCPAAQDVMVIGFGSGTTSGSALSISGDAGHGLRHRAGRVRRRAILRERQSSAARTETLAFSKSKTNRCRPIAGTVPSKSTSGPRCASS